MFFPLLFLAAYELPGGLAATLQTLSPLAVMAIALPVLGERPGARRVLAGLVGVVGVGLLVLRAGSQVSVLGVVAAVASVLVSAVGFVLVKRWQPPTDMLTSVSWQLVAGGLVLVPVALVVEGPPPALSVANVGGLLWLSTAGTALAYVCWFRGLVRMPAGAAALVGLVNPVVGTLLGVAFAGEVFGWAQALGMVLVLGGVVLGQRYRRGRAAVLRTSPSTSGALVGGAAHPALGGLPRGRGHADRPRLGLAPQEAGRRLEAAGAGGWTPAAS
jgi:probable blue pigment (indigoidine) exporter